MCSITPLNAGQPQEVTPSLSADVRPPCAKRAVCATLWRSPPLREAVFITHKARRRQDGVRNGAKRAQRIGADVCGLHGAQAEWSGEAVVPQPSRLMRSGALCAVLLGVVRVERSGVFLNKALYES